MFCDLGKVGEQSVIQKIRAEKVSGFEFEWDDQKVRRLRETIKNWHRVNSKRYCSSVVSRSRSQALNDSEIIQSKKDAQKLHREEQILESNMEWRDSSTRHFLCDEGQGGWWISRNKEAKLKKESIYEDFIRKKTQQLK
jgi:hypothetical protein